MAFNPIAYLLESKAELAKVVWPTKKETLRLTLIVAALSVAVGIYVGAIDTVLAKLTEEFLR